MSATNHQWVDSVADWAESHPITQRAHKRYPGETFDDDQPQPAEACTEIGMEDQTDSADGVFYVYMLVILAVIGAAVLAVLS